MRKFLIIKFIFIILLFVFLVGCTQISNELGSETTNNSYEDIKPDIFPTELTKSETPQVLNEPEIIGKIEEENLEAGKLEPIIELNEVIPEEKKPISVSSPLQGISLEELNEIISNPFEYVGAGKDEGHHGTDFSFYRYKSFDKMENLPILSIFPGQVRSLINNRPPYGNMIMIETLLINFPENTQNTIINKYSTSDLPYYTNLNCPDGTIPNFSSNTNNLSLYVLYAHLLDMSEKVMDQEVNSGEIIGLVGNSGLSGNPHLHLEFRIGPSNYRFQDMAHYDNAATPDEINNYCLWRVSGYFFQFDPMEFIGYYLQNR